MTSNQKPSTGNQPPAAQDWTRMWFKANKVWMAVDARGKPVIRDGKVLIKYQLKQDYEYWVKQNNVSPIDAPPPQAKPRPKNKTRTQKSEAGQAAAESSAGYESATPDTVCVFTDGASSGNPGPSGIGVVLQYGGHEKEISEFIGNATNNIAELKAIQAGLQALKSRELPVRLFTDSSYAFGLLVLNWKARKNQELVDSIKKTIARFKDLKIIKVKGHAGHAGNEKADSLATSAIKKAVG